VSATTLIAQDKDSFRVTGTLTFATARDLLQLSQSLFSQASNLSIDLSAVSAADSAGLALLIEWVRIASRANKPICFLHVPTQLRTLAKISDVEQLLGLSETVVLNESAS
jgi:phospholipid transport system transporter-binding protein